MFMNRMERQKYAAIYITITGITDVQCKVRSYNFSSGVSAHWDSFDLTVVGADQGCPYKVPKVAILDSMNSRNLILVHTSTVCECQADYMYSITFHLT